MRLEATRPVYIPSFWALQLGGWSLYALAVLGTSVPEWHQRGYFAYRAMSIPASFLASFLVYGVCKALWNTRASFLSSLVACASTCGLLGLAISAASLWAEIYLGKAPISFRMSYVVTGATTGAAFLVAWSAMFFGIKHYQALERERSRVRESESLAREAQLRALRFQLQPHFLFNTLNTIGTLILEQNSEGALQMISRLGNLLRGTLNTPELHLIPLADELASVKEYLGIEQVRFGSQLRIEFIIGGETLVAEVRRMLLQPLLENAVRHGIAQCESGGTIVVSAELRNAFIEIEVVNDVPPGSGVVSPADGIGLSNTRQRLNELFGAEGNLDAAFCDDQKYRSKISFPFKPSALHSEILE
jgi:two-component system, LytTR family, sensor kinase